ncbi:MAG: haloacid dehalogenase type II [Gammaproteobacteria bacterium]|nr:haloacid dehalogenase type II [Gammaproteobacteria bacterium]
MTVLGFDVYGTLIDTSGVVGALRNVVGDKAAKLAQIWRDKQLEYSFRRGLMRDYASFDVCIRDAFDYGTALLEIDVTAREREDLLGAYRGLPAFDDVVASLERLATHRFRSYALSNGTAADVESLLTNAGIREHFIDIVSVDEIGTFKPDPAVYEHFLRRAEIDGPNAWLVSSNPFDVIGAIRAGMRAVWIKRQATGLFDPWGIEPTLTVTGLAGLGDRIAEFIAKRT